MLIKPSDVWFLEKTKKTMEENLIKQNPRDELILKIRSHVDSQISATDNSKKINVYANIFTWLAKKYFNLDPLFLRNLNDQELLNLCSLIYEKAKRRLKWILPLFCLGCFALIPAAGVGVKFLCDGFNPKDQYTLKTYKFVILHKWFLKKFTAADLKRVIPNY